MIKLGQLSIILFSFIFSANAATLSNTKITVLMLDKQNGSKVYIDTSLEHPHLSPSCHASSWSYVLPLETDIDKHFYSALLTAFAAGKSINLIGNNDCAVHNGIETLRRIELK